MNRINWQTAFATAGITITGLIGAVFTSYQLLETNYQAKEVAMTMRVDELNKRVDRLISAQKDLSRQAERNKYQLEQICQRISDEETISKELQQYCFNIVTTTR